MKGRVRLERIIVIVEILVVLFLTLVTSPYHQNVLKQMGGDGGEDRNGCRYRYAMIAEDSDILFWEDVCGSTKEAIRRYSTPAELIGKSPSPTIEMEGLMNMAIIPGVDGAMLEYTGGHKMDERINEADKAGISVVAVFKDASDTSRIGFVGVDDRQLEWQYGEQVFKLTSSDKDDVEVTLLFHDRDNNSQEQIAEQISNPLVISPSTSRRARLIQETIRFTGKVDADEIIRNVFLRKEGIPGILACAEAVDTRAAYQVMIDYSKVGESQFLGYHKSDQIPEATRRGNIPVTLIIDMEQMGRHCVQVLEEYLQEGHASSHYSVGLQFVTKENVSQLMKCGR